jgi:phage gp16-like protein
MEKVTSQTILEELKELVEKKTPLDANVWLERAGELNILLGDELDKLAIKKSEIAQMRLEVFKTMEKKSVAEAKLITEASKEYLEMQKQENLCNVIIEFVRIAKIHSRKEGGF